MHKIYYKYIDRVIGILRPTGCWLMFVDYCDRRVEIGDHRSQMTVFRDHRSQFRDQSLERSENCAKERRESTPTKYICLLNVANFDGGKDVPVFLNFPKLHTYIYGYIQYDIYTRHMLRHIEYYQIKCKVYWMLTQSQIRNTKSE